MSKPKIFDDSIKISRSCGRIAIRSEGWTDGDVITPHGVVIVYAQGDSLHYYHTRLDFVHAGRLHMRNFSGKRYSRRGLVTIAKKFAQDVTLGAKPPKS